MSVSWLKNHAGFELSDDQMKDIPNPKAELITHVTFKTVQAFSLLGMVVAAPAVVAIRGPRNLLALRNKCISYAKGGAVIGVPAGPLMTYARMRSLDEDGVYDRCYRLRYNRGQVRVDRFWIIGGLVGMTAATATSGVATAGAVLGMNAGVLLAAAYNNM